jgi:hypothetical protein
MLDSAVIISNDHRDEPPTGRRAFHPEDPRPAGRENVMTLVSPRTAAIESAESAKLGILVVYQKVSSSK